MLRMAHRILTEGIAIKLHPKQHARLTPETYAEHVRGLREIVADCEVIVADNVARYVQEIARRIETFDGLKVTGSTIDAGDIVCAMPPFSSLLVEWSHCDETATSIGLSQSAVIVTSCDPAEVFPDGMPYSMTCDYENHIAVHGLHLYRFKTGPVCYDGNLAFYLCDKRTGKMVPDSAYSFNGTDIKYPPLAIPMMTLSFMHCKNVVHRDVTASEGPAAKWLRRQKAPTIKYHVLDINPMKEILRTEGGVETNGLKKALHICRGHFATYTPEKPLFGNIVGTVWKPAHVRGDIKQGAVVKDYRVNPE